MKLSSISIPLILLITLGLIIRLFSALIPGFKTDINAFYLWALRLNDLGLSNFYSKEVFTDYIPGYLYVLYFLGFIQKNLHLSTSESYFLLKLPSIFAE